MCNNSQYLQVLDVQAVYIVKPECFSLLAKYRILCCYLFMLTVLAGSLVSGSPMIQNQPLGDPLLTVSAARGERAEGCCAVNKLPLFNMSTPFLNILQ